MPATISRTPGELLLRVDLAFREGSLEDLLACYEANATMVVKPGVLAIGATAIREAFVAILAASDRPDVRHEKFNVIESGEIALFSSRWTLYSGDRALLTRYATTVLRRHADDGWRILIDNAHGPSALLG
jgi:ketosteroid isomerase-like protein